MNNEKWYSTTLDINACSDECVPLIKSTMDGFTDAMSKNSKKWLSYMIKVLDTLKESNDKGMKFDDYKEELSKDFPSYQDELKELSEKFGEELAELVVDQVSKAYQIGYVEGHHDGEQDVIRVFKEGKDSVIDNEDMYDSLIDTCEDISRRTFEEHTKGKPMFLTKLDEE